ncbi:MAG: hypothetical protein EP343_08750 [Deltaproteobacteria bacterium]|nr:MAG: hypothetical protein EP343_08750 [Deltaproteobacteria bacterium]
MRLLAFQGFLVVLLSLALFGCKDADLEALEAYQKAVTHHVRPAMVKFAKSLKGLGGIKQAEPLRLRVSTKAYPAYKVLKTALQQVPCQTETLRAIHKDLLASYLKLGEQLKRFGEQATTQTLRMKLVVALRYDAKQVDQAWKTYQQKLKAYVAQVQKRK